MTTIINGSSPSITFSDSTTQASAALAAGGTIASGTITSATLPTATVTTLNAPSGVLATQNGMTGICKAWVYWTGGSSPSIQGSFNVSSVTRISEGYYSINFTTAMPNSIYAVTSSGQNTNATQFGTIPNVIARTTTSVTMTYHNSFETIRDGSNQSVVINGN